MVAVESLLLSITTVTTTTTAKDNVQTTEKQLVLALVRVLGAVVCNLHIVPGGCYDSSITVLFATLA